MNDEQWERFVLKKPSTHDGKNSESSHDSVVNKKLFFFMLPYNKTCFKNDTVSQQNVNYEKTN